MNHAKHSDQTSKLFASDIDVRAFARVLRTIALGKEITYYPRTVSTNDLALDAARKGALHGQLFITDEQVAGRGRRGRSWESPAGLSLLFSVVIRPQCGEIANPSWISLLAGLSVVETLQDVCQLDAALKWPNDIVIPCSNAPGWRKLGGILCESAITALTSPATALKANQSSQDYVVVGIGLNINQETADLPATAKVPATSVRLETNAQFGRQNILRAILECFEARLLELNASDTRLRLKHVIADRLSQWWTTNHLLRVQSVVVNSSAGILACLSAGEDACATSGLQILEGYFAGLDDLGRLKLKTATCDETILVDAEILSVSVRP
ncbi:MAG: biotin--[acetyl-CoA-carboxylase] ligase [Planctomycetota bacterium]